MCCTNMPLPTQSVRVTAVPLVTICARIMYREAVRAGSLAADTRNAQRAACLDLSALRFCRSLALSRSFAVRRPADPADLSDLDFWQKSAHVVEVEFANK